MPYAGHDGQGFRAVLWVARSGLHCACKRCREGPMLPEPLLQQRCCFYLDKMSCMTCSNCLTQERQ